MPAAVRPGPAATRRRRRAGRGATALLVMGAVLPLAGCAPFFYPAAQVEVSNHSVDPVQALVSASPESELFTEIVPGATAGLDWASCGDGWVVVRYAGGELFREELRICPDDTVDVTLNREVVVECGRFSARERSDC